MEVHFSVKVLSLLPVNVQGEKSVGVHSFLPVLIKSGNTLGTLSCLGEKSIGIPKKKGSIACRVLYRIFVWGGGHDMSMLWYNTVVPRGSGGIPPPPNFVIKLIPLRLHFRPINQEALRLHFS